MSASPAPRRLRRHARRLAFFFAALALAAGRATADRPEIPDLSGHWVLDRRAPEERGDPAGRGPEATRPPRRTGGPSDGRSPLGGDPLPRAERERLAALQRGAATLDIRREGTGFVIEDALGRAWPAPADGSERAVEGADGTFTYVRSEWGEWEGLRLWRVRAGEPTVQETFALSAEGDELLVETTFPGESWGAAPIRRRYRRAPEKPPAAP